MMKILFFIPTLRGGGAEKVLSDLAKFLNKNKYEITIKTIFNEGVHVKKVKSYVNYDYVFNSSEDRTIRSRISHKLMQHLQKLPSKILWILFIHQRYDIEIAFMEGISTKIISGSMIKKSKKIAWVHTDLISNTESEKQYLNLEEAIKCYKVFDEIFCVSEIARESFEKKYDMRASVQNNIIDDAGIKKLASEAIKETNLFKDSFTIISIGRLIKVKGYQRLLETHLKLLNEGFNYRLMIIGDGPDRASLQKFIDDNNISENTFLLGFKRNPYNYLARSNLFVSSSFAEGYPLVLAEALTLEIPVMATENAGAINVLENGRYGLLVENNTDSLYEHMKRILIDRELYTQLKEKAKLGSKIFNTNQKINEFEKILDSQ